MAFSACTKTIQNTLNWALAFILTRPPTGVAGIPNEPALTIANLVASTIISPPFAWQWNRATTSINLTTGTTDYPVALSTFGWLEKATVAYVATPPTGVSSLKEIEISNFLSVDATQGTPFKICISNDDNAGNITFRVMPAPDQAYTLNLTYQLAPPVISALTNTWAPIPDKYNFLYERGVLAHLHGMYDSATYLQELQLFFRQLVGCSEGLDDTAKAIFLLDRLEQLKTQAFAQNATSGTLKRGM